jgi:hypothetical protein
MTKTINDYASLAKHNLDAALWYDSAIAEIVEVCRRESWDRYRFTSVLALTSPRCSVRRNVRLALSYMREHRLHIIRGVRQSLDNWERTGTINGPKVSAFFRALADDDSAIVLDVHMANLFGVRQSSLSAAKGRLPIENTIREVSQRIGVSPRDVQACLWFGHRRSLGENPESFPILHEHANWLAFDREFPNGQPIRQWADRSGHFQPRLWSNE